ncbi:MAG: disulfide bond chaperone [Puniceicoccaceae bacterium]|nr:MAG: disulfide bond chaperone [Puniceicoccaceae bacterium]
MEKKPVSASEGVPIQTYFVRYRNVLLARADFEPLYIDYYLHLAEAGFRMGQRLDSLFKTALAAFALHCASRPRNETIGWTLNFQDPLVNLFLGGDNDEQTVVGRLFAENVKEAEENSFYAEVARGNGPVMRSIAPFEGECPLRAVEAFYRQSEQRPARLFALGPEEFAMVTAHPDCDQEWFDQLDEEEVHGLGGSQTLAPLENRRYRWRCGCSRARILGILGGAARGDVEGLFGEESELKVNCPRCGRVYPVRRDELGG